MVASGSFYEFDLTTSTSNLLYEARAWALLAVKNVGRNNCSGQKTCQWYLPAKSVVKSMSIVFTHKICDKKHVHSICQSKI